MVDIFVAEATVDAVGQHHQIRIGEARLILDLGLEKQADAEFARPLLQNQEQRAARAATKAVATDPVNRATEVHRDIVPIGELLRDAPVAQGIVFLEIIQRRVRKHHAKAEGIIGAVALVNRDLGLGALLLQQDRGIETGRTSADDRDLHNSLRRSGTNLDYFNPKALSGQAQPPIPKPDRTRCNLEFSDQRALPGRLGAHPR